MACYHFFYFHSLKYSFHLDYELNPSQSFYFNFSCIEHPKFFEELITIQGLRNMGDSKLVERSAFQKGSFLAEILENVFLLE
jgi:hypothetical protein